MRRNPPRLLGVLAVAGAVLSARSEVRVSPCAYTGWAQETFERRDGVQIVGDANRYAFHLVSEKPKASGGASTFFLLTQPRRMWGFGQNGSQFLNLTVNGIPLARTVVGDRTFRCGKTDATAHLNFDGAAVDLTAYVKPGSPLLWFTLKPAARQLRPIEKIELSLNCVVSDYRTKAGESERYVKTAVRTLGPDNAPQALAATDGFVLFGDRKLDGSGPGKGYGPSYVALPDFAPVKRASVLAWKSPNARLTVELKPDFAEFTFAILQTQGAVTEEEVLAASASPSEKRAASHATLDFPFEAPQALTVSVLLKPEVPFAEDHRAALAVSLGTGWGDGFRLCLRPVAAKDAYRPLFEVGRARNGARTVEDEGIRWRAGVWHRVTGVLDGRRARLFLDGREIAAADYEGLCPLPKEKTIHIGWDAPRWGTGTHPFLAASAKVWDRALSSDEIAALSTDRPPDTPELEGFFLRRDRGELVPADEIARWRAGQVLSLMAAVKLDEIQEESLIADGDVRQARALFERTHAELCAAGRRYDAANGRDRFVGLLENYGRREALEFAEADYREAKASGDALLPVATLRLMSLRRRFGEQAAADTLRRELQSADLTLYPQVAEALGLSSEGTAHAERGAAVSRALPAKRFFVAPTGDDRADGSLARPFATPARAREAVRAFVRENGRPTDGVAVCLRGGAYVMREPLALTEEDSGTAAAPTVWCAWRDERPVLTGAFAVPELKPVTDAAALARLPPAARAFVRCCDVRAAGYAAWDRALPQYGYYVEAPPPITELYCDGRRLEPARYPNEGWLKIKGFGTPADSVVRVDMDDFDGWRDEPDLAATGFWLWFWGDLTTQVAGVDPARREVTLNLRVGKARKLVKMREGHTFFLLNALHAIDRPGEWFLDRRSGVLYVWPPKEGARYALSECDGPFLTVTKARAVRVEGLVFECGRLTGVGMDGCRDCVFAGNVVRHFGGAGMTARDCTACTFEGNVFRSFGHGALEVSGGDRKTLTHAGNRIANNDFSTVELRRRTYAPHLHLSGVGTEVSRNRFTDSPSSAMRLEGNDFFVVSNLVENVLLESDDQGGLDIYRNATYFGNRYCWNVWKDIGGRGSADAVPAGQAAVRFDGNISGQTVYANRFIRCGRGMMGAIQSCGGRLHAIDNNLFVDCGRGMSMVKYPLDFWAGRMQKSIADCLAEVDIKSPPFSTRYPGIDRLFETDQVNRFTRNVTVGRTPLLVDPPAATRVLSNRHFARPPDMRKVSAESCLADVPDEDEVGPLPTEAFLRACRNDGRSPDFHNAKRE